MPQKASAVVLSRSNAGKRGGEQDDTCCVHTHHTTKYENTDSAVGSRDLDFSEFLYKTYFNTYTYELM